MKHQRAMTLGFPANLRVKLVGDETNNLWDSEQSRVNAHNRAVNACMGLDGADSMRRNEREVFDLVNAIESLSHHESVESPFFQECVLEPMLDALGNLLNHDIGRLIPSVLSGFASDIGQRYDIAQ